MKYPQNLVAFVHRYAIRGSCRCGTCADAKAGPEQLDMLKDHVVDLTFFKVSADEEAKADEMRELVKAEALEYLDGREHSYLEVGADVDDQGTALMLIGLGHVLGVWKALCPETLMPFLDAETKNMMASRGMISLQATP